MIGWYMRQNFARVIYLAIFFVAFAGCDSHRRTNYIEVPGPTPAPIVSVVTVQVPAPPVDPASSVVVPVPAGRWETTPGGVQAWIPAWLDNSARIALRPAALDEIDRVVVERNDSIQRSSIPSNTTSVPPSWRVVIMDPGSFSTPASPTGLARGVTDFSRVTIYVSWVFPSDAPDKQGRLLPALAHEAAHAWVFVLTGDVNRAANAGH